MNECAECKAKAKIFTAAGFLLGIAVGAGILIVVRKRG